MNEQPRDEMTTAIERPADVHTFAATAVTPGTAGPVLGTAAGVVSGTAAAGASSAARFPGYRIAAIVPCFNEEAAIGKVVSDLRASVPDMDVYVYDNASTDATVTVARQAGAIVRTEHAKGKGNVVRRAFADVDADIYLLIDGDDTYDAAAAPQLIQALIDGPYDHVLGIREPETSAADVYRPAHERGNIVLNGIVGRIFGSNAVDMLSGYRVFSRRFVKSFPAVSREFEIETELTVHCLALRTPATSVRVGFRDRPEGSESKLRTYRDGWKILKLILSLARHERPIAFYGSVSAALSVLAVLVGVPGLVQYVRSGHVPHFALSLTFLGVAALCFALGLVLDGTRKTRHETSRLAYLNHAAVREQSAQLNDLSQRRALNENAVAAKREGRNLIETVASVAGPVPVAEAS